MVPKTVPYKEVKEKKTPAGINKTNGESSVEPGQATLDGKKLVVNGTNGFGHAGPSGTGGDEDPRTRSWRWKWRLGEQEQALVRRLVMVAKEPSQDVEMH